MRKTLPTICLSVSALLFSTAAYGGEEIRIGGGGAALHTVFQPLKPHFEKASGITLINLQSSPKGGLLNLLEGRVDVSAAAHSLDTLLASLAEDGVKIDRSRLIEHQIGVNRITVIAHPDNRLNRLTRQQIKAIFTGQVANWQEVGGDNREILVVWGRGTPGQNAEFTQKILDGQSVTKEALESTNYTEIKETVAATPEAVGIVPVSTTDATVRIIENDAPLNTPINAVTIGKPSAKVRKLLDYIRGEGKSHIRQ